MNPDQKLKPENLPQGIGEDFLHMDDVTRSQDETVIQPPIKVVNVPQVRFKTVAGRLNLLLPAEQELKDEEGNSHVSLTWNDLLEQLQQRMTAQSSFLQPQTLVYLETGDRLLDVRQLQEIGELLQTQKLVLHSISTYRRQTAIAAVTAGFSVEQVNNAPNLFNLKEGDQPQTPQDEPLYIKMTVRSGTEIRHSGSVIVFGDVNAGGEIIADGDVLVWGKLKGIAHAGAKGNSQAVIMALHLEATQLRIADFVARVETPSTNFSPEVAHVNRKGNPSICIVAAADYRVNR